MAVKYGFPHTLRDPKSSTWAREGMENVPP
jgi:hypothetical protein